MGLQPCEMMIQFIHSLSAQALTFFQASVPVLGTGVHSLQMPCSLQCSTVDSLCIGGLLVRMAGVSRGGARWAPSHRDEC